MKVSLEINDIDYGALIKFFLPMLHEKLATTDGITAKLLGKIAGMSPDTAAAMFDKLPQNTKDDIAVYLINNKKDEMISKVKEYAGSKGMSFSIDEFLVTK